jgi:hypothetical protein
MIYSVTM